MESPVRRGQTSLLILPAMSSADQGTLPADAATTSAPDTLPADAVTRG